MILLSWRWVPDEISVIAFHKPDFLVSGQLPPRKSFFMDSSSSSSSSNSSSGSSSSSSSSVSSNLYLLLTRAYIVSSVRHVGTNKNQLPNR